MEEDILEIIQNEIDVRLLPQSNTTSTIVTFKKGVSIDCHKAAKEIADNFTRFVEWKDFSIDVGTRLDFDDNPKMYYVAETLYDIKYFDFAGIYNYWSTNIRDK